mmetsp:Transcript_61355/g.92703  ORF Transcript_61355/g.92703 Transcript_61355/m.92703 type:complete len:238 (+) Transcript_61355:454-1167(+)
MKEITAGMMRRSSIIEPRKYLTTTKFMKITPWPGRLVARMLMSLPAGSLMKSSISSKREPEIAEMKKIWMIMKMVSFENSEAFNESVPMCPSSSQKNFRIIGSRFVSTTSPTGDRNPRKSSRRVNFSPAVSRAGILAFRDSTLVKLATKVIGKVQSRHVTAVRAPARRVVTCTRLKSNPRFFQNTHLGCGALQACTVNGDWWCSTWAAMVAAHRVLKEMRAESLTSLSSCVTFSVSI